jgi:tetratricopeptide (TPR) repeat protein
LGNKAASETALLDIIELSKRTQGLDYIVGHAEAKLGGLWIEMGKYQEAEKVLLRAVQRIETDFTARHLLCRTYKEQMKYEAAEEQAAMLLSMVSEDVDEEAIDAELRLFELYAAMDNFDKAQAWAGSLFDRLKHLTDYQGNPLDVASALQHLIKFFERTKDEQKLFEARVVVSFEYPHYPLRLSLPLSHRLYWDEG